MNGINEIMSELLNLLFNEFLDRGSEYRFDMNNHILQSVLPF